MVETHITQFDKAHYEQLIRFLTDVDDNLNHDPQALGVGANLKLDSTLGSRLHAGSQKWSVVQGFTDRAKSFGTSANARYTETESSVRTFATALNNAKDVFDETDDLATYDASKFVNDYPDVGGTPDPGTSTP